MKNAIKDSLFFFKDTLQNLIILGIYLLPFLVILVLVGYAFYKLGKKFKKNRPNKENKL